MVNVLLLSHHFIWSGGSLWTGPVVSSLWLRCVFFSLMLVRGAFSTLHVYLFECWVRDHFFPFSVQVCVTQLRLFVWVTWRSLNAVRVTFVLTIMLSLAVESCVSMWRSRLPPWWSFRDCYIIFLFFYPSCLPPPPSSPIPSNPSSPALTQGPYLVGVPSISIHTSHAKQLWRTASIFSCIVRAPGGCG